MFEKNLALSGRWKIGFKLHQVGVLHSKEGENVNT